jgi:hypothetical protein
MPLQRYGMAKSLPRSLVLPVRPRRLLRSCALCTFCVPPAFRLDALAQRIHEVHYIRGHALLRTLDLLAVLLFPEQFFQSVLVPIRKFFWIRKPSAFHPTGLIFTANSATFALFRTSGVVFHCQDSLRRLRMGARIKALHEAMQRDDAGLALEGIDWVDSLWPTSRSSEA